MLTNHGIRLSTPAALLLAGLLTFAGTLAPTFAGTAAAADAAHYADPNALQDVLERIDSGSYTSRTEVPEGPVLRKGAEGDAVSTVIKRLQEGGYLPSNFEGTTYSEKVMAAVEAFQKDHGLMVDGLVGPGTRAAMNRPPSERVEEIRASLEEQKAFFSEAGDRFVMVNIPDAHLVYFEDGKPQLEMRVIVGQEGWGTPTMNETIEHIVVNPDWDVPASIVAADIAPQVAADPGYIAANNMVIFDGWGPNAPRVDPGSIDWGSVTEESWSYHLRQLPGPDNPLGQVKISFPNDEAIYLHGTPAKQLFEKNQRGLSHGCIRMEKPVELAGVLLEQGTDDWDTARLSEAVKTNEQQTIALDETLPVHLVYWTAFVDASGDLQLRPDLYDKLGS